MILSWGSYSHEDGEVSLSVQATVEMNAAQTVKWVRKVFQISGYLVADSSTEMKEKALALEAAYAVNGRDLKLKDGALTTHVALLNADCYGGTRVTQRPSFPDMSNAALITFLPFQVTVEGLVRDPLALATVAFEERIARSGGGPRKGFLEPLTGEPIEQLLKKRTVYKVTQSGSAVGLTAYPTPPLPLWPSALMEAPDIQQQAPRRTGYGSSSSYTEFGITWSYRFESRTPLIGTPNVWT